MKTFDLARLALKNIKGLWAVLPVIGFAIAAFCLCFAGAILTAVSEEKAQPYELILSAQGTSGITDNRIADILKIPDVKAATGIMQIPVTVRTGKHQAQLTLTGLDGSYINRQLTRGSLFAPQTVMPYILLNEAACKMFVAEETGISAETPDVDWLNASFSLISGEDTGSVTSKVCGILSDGGADDAEPVAYVSTAVAKELLLKNKQAAVFQAAWARITNIGCADAVSAQIAALGLGVNNANEQTQAKWDMQMKEMAYLIVAGAFCLLCAGALLAAYREIIKQKQKGSFESLRWIGLKERQIKGLFILQSFFIAILGTAIGIAVSLALPSFLPTEPKESSSYMLSIPFGAAALSLFLCIFAGVIPACFAKARQPSP